MGNLHVKLFQIELEGEEEKKFTNYGHTTDEV